MPDKIVKTAEEIRELADRAADDTQNLSGMSYQEGITAALEWALGEREGEGEGPLD